MINITDRSKGVLSMLFSAFCFAAMAAMIKLTGELPLFEKVFFRNFIIMFRAAFTAVRTKAPLFGKWENQKFLLGRAIAGTMGVISFFYAVDNMYLADSAMLNKLSPFFVTLFAYLLLKEKLSRLHIPALIVVFAASLLIIKPKFDLSVLPALSGFASAVFSGIAYTLLRFMRNRERPETIIFYFSLTTVVTTFPLMILNFQIPTGSQWIFLLATGLFAAGGQFGLTLAFKYVEANEASLFTYSNIIFAAIMGFMLWGEIPDFLSIIGGVLIIGTSALIFFYNNNKTRLQNK